MSAIQDAIDAAMKSAGTSTGSASVTTVQTDSLKATSKSGF